jgi:penicillin amidase
MEGARLGKRIVTLAVIAGLALTAACSEDDGGGTGGTGGAGGSGGSGGTGGSGISIPGLTGPVEVRVDEPGMLHASCLTDGDCARVLGYFHAEHRFFQMDLQRRAARGELASLIPMVDQLEQAVLLRQYFSTAQGEPIEEKIWEALDADTRAHLEAYSQGVNAWLADLRAGRNGARLSEEYAISLLGATPANIRDWEPLDSVAFARLMTLQLSESSSVELGVASLLAKLDPEVAADLLTLLPGEESYTVQAPATLRARAPAPHPAAALREIRGRIAVAQELLARARDARDGLFPFVLPMTEAGSNNWVVAPSRTANGLALLANDPHLSLSNPPVWYFAELDATSMPGATGTMHVAGGTFPGIPYVPIGHSAHVAWGNTVAFYDVTDVYVETLSEDGTAVIFNGAEVPIVTREYEFPKGTTTVKRTLEWVPHHGPILQKDPATRTAITVKWTGQEPTLELRAFHELARARSVAEAKAALQHFGVGAQNTVVIDTQGHIGWYPLANVPNRPWASPELAPWLPLPGDGTAEWDGYVDRETLPQVTDPAAGFIATANQAMDDSLADGDPTNDGHPVLQTSPAPGFRHRRIVDLLEEGGSSHSWETMLAIQADTVSLPAMRVVPHLRTAAAAGELTEQGQAVLDAMDEWQFSCPTGLEGPRPDSPKTTDADAARESIACTAFHHVVREIYRAAFLDEVKAAGAGNNLGAIPGGHNQMMKLLVVLLERPELLHDPDGLWDDDATEEVEGKEEILRKALDMAGQRLAAFGPPDNWRWGKLHTVTFTSQLELLNPALSDGPWANDGGLFTVDVANPAVDGSFAHGSGASLRLVVEAREEGMKSWLQLPGGQDLHRDGTFYGSWIVNWLANEPFEVPFGWEEADDAAVVRLSLHP